MERVPETRPIPDASISAEPSGQDIPDDLKMPDNGLVLFDNGEVLVMAEWEQGREFENPVTVWIQNDSDTDLIVTTQQLYVNGTRMESASLYCQAEPGRVAQGELLLDEEELKLYGITDVQQIRLDLWLLDQDLRPVDIAQELVTLDYAVSG